MAHSKNDNFAGLVQGISEDERQNMLNSMKKQASEDTESGIAAKKDAENPSEILMKKYREMSFFQKIWFRIKSLVTSTSMENVVNSYLVTRSAAFVERDFSGLINFKKGLFLNSFYEKIEQLKIAADFFKPYMADVEENPDYFYVLLGTVAMPEIAQQIDSESNPYQYPFTKELNNEMRASLLHKMESIQDNIPQSSKSVMYTAVRSTEWLRQFVRLPFDRFLLKFHINENGSRECAFSQCPNEMAAFAKVFTDPRPVTEEIIQGLHLLQNHNNPVSATGEIEMQDNFFSSAGAQVGVLTMFGQTVPMKEISQICFFNAMYRPEIINGGEDWLLRYKAEQKVIFDQRWADWLHEYKKYQINIRLTSYFGAKDFPRFPYRPWKNVFGGVTFKYEITLGFLYYFFKVHFSEYLRVVKTVILEGEFSIQENRQEFTDVIGDLNKINTALDNLSNQLATGGEYGLALAKYEGSAARNKTSVERVDVILADVERCTANIINDFGKACRSLENLLIAMVGEKISAYYGPLTNLTHIAGKDNKDFREKLMICRNGISHSYELVKDMEALDQETK